jgi:TPR repeat protein
VDDSDDIVATDDGSPTKHLWGLIIAVILASGITLWLLTGGDEPTPDQASQEPLPTLEPQPGSEAASGAATAAKGGTGDRGRAIISRLGRGADSAAEAYAEGRQLQEAGSVEDAYLLYFFAAKQGHTEAALALGAQADPAHFDPVTSALRQADPGQAYKWYRKAADNGSAEAERRLAALFEKVKNAAAAGDQQAGRLLLQWR